jgi:signal transduction histidine kinase
MRLRRFLRAAVLLSTCAPACRPVSSREPALLSIAEAKRGASGREVRLRGRLGFYSRNTGAAYLQADDAGLFLETANVPSVPAVGGSVEVEGVLERRGDDTLLRARRFRIVPTGGPTPEPRRLPVTALADDGVAGTWVAIDGVVTGVAEQAESHSVVIESDGRSFTACIAEPRSDRPPSHASIVGFRVRAQGIRVAAADREASGAGCTLRLPTRLSLRYLQDAPDTEAAPSPPLTTIETIRALSPEDARQRRPVRVRGIVTTHDAHENLLFVQDGSAGIYVEAWRHLHQVTPGEYVEITGSTGPGAFAPVIDWPRLTPLGRGRLPEPIKLDAAVLPQYDSQWIELEGVVRAAGLKPPCAVLKLMAFGERVDVHVAGLSDLARAQTLVDAEVRLRGVYRARFSPTRQLLGVEIHVPSPDLISVLAPAPADPHAAALRRSDTVLEFQPHDATGRRIHVRGVVMLHRPGRSLYLRDAGGPLQVDSPEETAVAPGDEVDVVGFPGLGEHRPVLLDASYRVLGRKAPPQPLDVPADRVVSGALEGELIRIDGRLIEHLTGGSESRLVLQSPLQVFDAVLPHPARAPAEFERLRPGSLVRVAGICVVKGDAIGVPPSFQILLRSADDLVVVENAPWWTRERMVLAVSGLFAVAAASLVWVGTLRRRVREQTEILRGRLAREAALEERTRLARELHDTLEQNLAGVGYALEAVKHTLEHPTVARSHLDHALSHVDQSMMDARRSVWALRPRALDEGDLASAFTKLAHEVTRGGVARADVHVEGSPWPLQSSVEDHLFRIGQEAVTNALKHAEASRLRIDLRFEETAIEMVVQDDGRGFDQEPASGGGHLGLVGMRERVAQVDGTLDVTTAAGAGTTVRVAVPRRSAAVKVS